MEYIKDMFHSVSYRMIIMNLIIMVSAVYLIYLAVSKHWFSRIKGFLADMIIPMKNLYGPIRFILPVLCFVVILPFLSLHEKIKILLNHILSIGFIIGIAWLIIRIFENLKIMILSRYKIDVKDNLIARRMKTQLSVIHRVISAIVVIIASSAILMTFDKVRQMGVSILASAGIAGVIIGFAAQRSLSMLIAGIQIAITQPIRIDDVVIVENEWGWIEEITLTYVVVRIWDQRRLVVPITFFIECSFQNWTRTSAELLGTVYLYADYDFPVDPLRTELGKIVNASPLWDKRVAKIDVTNASEKAVEFRALVSAENSSDAWDLRCHVREKLIDFMQKNYPEKLPRVRLESVDHHGESTSFKD